MDWLLLIGVCLQRAWLSRVVHASCAGRSWYGWDGQWCQLKRSCTSMAAAGGQDASGHSVAQCGTSDCICSLHAACALRSCVGVGTATTQACGICVPGICVPVAKRIHDDAVWRPAEAVQAIVGSCSVLQWPPGGLFGAYYRFGADLSIALLWTSTSGAYCSVGTGCGAYCSVGTGSCGVFGATVFVSACA